MMNRTEEALKIDSIYPTTLGQQGLWLTQAIDADSCGYNVVRVFSLSGAVVPRHVKKAFDLLLARHPSLRARFVHKEGKLFQHIQTDLPFYETICASSWSPTRLEEYCRKVASIPFDLSVGPLFKVKLLVQRERAVLVLVIHHIVIDLWSEIILSKDFLDLYRLASQGREPGVVSPLQTSYEDFVTEERRRISSGAYESSISFWREYLASENCSLDLPFAHTRQPVQSFTGATLSDAISEQQASAIRQIASSCGVTPYVLLVSVFHLLIGSYTQRKQVMVGTTHVGRTHAKYRNVVGFFVNPVPIKFSLPDRKATFVEYLINNGERVVEGMRKSVPFPFLLDQLSITRDPSYHPIFQVMFNYVGKLPFWQAEQTLELGGEEQFVMRPIDVAHQTAQFDLVVNVLSNRKMFHLSWEYNTDLFASPQVETFVGKYRYILDQVVRNPQIFLDEIALLTEPEKVNFLKIATGSRVNIDLKPNLYDAFLEKTESVLDRIALIEEEQQITYAQLRARIDLIAQALSQSGATRDNIIGIMLPRSVDAIASIFAVLKIGAVFLPLDPEYPQERIESIVDNCRALVLVAEHNQEVVARYDRVLILEQLILSARAGAGRSMRELPGNELAYLIYTSGSTGTPKGVMIPQNAILNYINFAISQYVDAGIEKFPLFTSLAFDLTLTAIFVPLFSGRTIDIYTDTSVERNLQRLLTEGSAAACKVTPSHLAALVALMEESDHHGGPSTWIVGGENLSASLAQELSARLSLGSTIYNEYGPTETTIGCMLHRFRPDSHPRQSVSIGAPIQNASVYLLDDKLECVLDLVPGEVYIGGVGLAWGYHHDPVMTAQSFIPNPFETGSRLYKTGDCARRLPNGTIEYLGRLDHQVKIRGFRVELEEIESHLKNYPDVQNVCVLDQTHRLVGFFEAKNPIAIPALRKFLGQFLPHYMIPDALVQVDQFELTTHGKIDRTQFPEVSAVSGVKRVDPETALQIELMNIWADVLGLELNRFGIEHNFFELGGDSIQAIQISARMRMQGIDSRVEHLFLYPTVKAISEHVTFQRGKKATSPPSTNHAQIEENYPLTPIQQGILFQSSINADQSVYFEQVQCTISASIDEQLFLESIELLATRHPMLRASFIENELGECRCVVGRAKKMTVAFQDLSQLTRSEQRAVIDRYLVEDRAEGFDVYGEDLLRLALFKRDKEEGTLVLSAHHILIDGWSLGVLIRDLSHLYLSKLKLRVPMLPKLSRYGTYMEWLESQDKSEALNYWTDRLSGIHGPTPVLGRSSLPGEESLRGEYSFLLSGMESVQIREMARSCRSTVSSIFQVIWSALLSFWNGRDDLIFGTVAAIRPPEIDGIENMVGLLIHTFPVRVKVSDSVSWKELVEQLHQDWAAAQTHLVPSLTELQEAVGWAEPLFDHLVVFENFPFEQETLIKEISVFEQTSYDFNLYIQSNEVGRYEIRMVYNQNRFQEPLIRGIETPFRSLFKQMGCDLGQKIKDGSYVDKSTHEHLLNLGRGPITVEDDQTIIQHFADRVRLAPSACAVREVAQAITLQELDARSNQLAHYLRKQGVGPESIVALSFERSTPMIVAILAIRKAGGAYLPLDLSAPTERRKNILKESRAEWLLEYAATDPGMPVTQISYLEAGWRSEPDVAVTSLGATHNLAYLLYTSGSTGQPKGVMVEERSLVNLLNALEKLYPMGQEDRFLFKTTYTFDVSCTELFGWCMGKGQLVILEPGAERDPFLIAEAIVKYRITHINFVPSMLQTFLNVIPKSQVKRILDQLKFMFSAGEVLTRQLQQQFLAFAPKAKLIDLYGPTEGTIYATAVEKQALNSSIGSPLANMQAYILDPALNVTPPGVPGTLYLGGRGLARGYLHQPGLTAERFLPSPFGSGSRIYNTADLARWSLDGSIEYLGRQDRQIKIRGFRVELGEIEQHLMQSNLLKQVLVIAQIIGRETELCAYFVPYQQCDRLQDRLREVLKASVPHYMIPSYFCSLQCMPLSTSGKIDHKQLPSVFNTLSHKQISDIPNDMIAQTLLELWADLLQISKATVSVNDIFLECGGHSIKAMQLISRIRHTLGVEVPLKDFFDHPSFGSLLYLVRTGRKSIQSLEKNTDRPYYPLTFAQRRLFTDHHLAPEGVQYNLPGLFLLQAEPDIQHMNDALASLAARHASLRTRFTWIDGEVCQIVEEKVALVLEERTLIAEDEAKKFIQPFDLGKAPLMRAYFSRVSPDRYLLFFDLHHIVADGISLNLLITDFTKLYRGETLPPLELDYQDYALWTNSGERSEWIGRGKKFWLNYLSGELPELQLPNDCAQECSGRSANRVIVEWEGGWVEQLRALATQERTTLNVLLLTLLQTCLYRYSGQEDILIGLPTAGRHLDTRLEQIVGMFVHTLILRGRPSAEKSFIQFLGEVRNDFVEIYEHQDCPFEIALEELNEHSIAKAPFGLFFAFQNFEHKELELDGVSIESIKMAPREVKFDLSFEVIEQGAKLIFHVDFAEHLFEESTINQFMRHLHHLALSILSHSNRSLGELGLISEQEKSHILNAGNETKADFPRDRTIIDLFQAQAQLCPEQIALMSEDETVTYHAFDRETDLYALELQARGVMRGDLVAVMTERSVEMMIGIYAVLKLGAAYLPIDCAWPHARIKGVLERSKPKLILVQQGKSFLPDRFEDRQYPLKRCKSEKPALLKTVGAPTDLAYVLLTSGSTGEPKGVLIAQQAVVNRIDWMQKAYPIQPHDVILQKTPITFDVSVWELFWWAVSGASLYLPKPGIEKDPKALLNVLSDGIITVIHFVPSMLSAFIDYCLTESLSNISGLKEVFVSGEAIQGADVRKFYQCFPTSRLINLYGPTEATVDVSHYLCQQGAIPNTIPIGSPIQNIDLHVLNKMGELQPVGIPGELYIGGVGLAWGYLASPHLTAERFIPHPFKRSERLYQTGDLAKRLPSGEILFLGRLDRQVKIRGMRVELEEIESALMHHSAINQGVVIAKPTSSGHRLIGYATLRTHTRLSKIDLKRYLQSRLPDYMVPSEWMILSEFPLTSSGKIDRQRLPKPLLTCDTSAQAILPAKAQQTADILLSIWKQVLGHEAITYGSNFFDLGGDSILAIQIVAKARARGIDLHLQQIIELQTIERLSDSIGAIDQNSTIDQGTVVGYSPITPIQKWLFETCQQHPHHFNQAVLLNVRSPLSMKGIDAALKILNGHHDMLRTKLLGGDLYFQEASDLRVDYVDLSSLTSQEQIEHAQQAKDRAHSEFDLVAGNWIRVLYFHWGRGRQDQMLWVMHHLITDGVSWRILLDDFCQAYQQIELLPKTTSFRDWAELLVEERQQVQIAYWLDPAFCSPPSLPLDFPDAPGGNHVKEVLVLDEDCTDTLLRSSDTYSRSMRAFLLAALLKTVDDIFGITHLVIAMESHGREHVDIQADVSRTIGWFTSLYPVVFNYNPVQEDSLTCVDRVLKRIPNQGLDYGICRYYGDYSQEIKEIHPSICFNYLGQTDQILAQLPLFEGEYLDTVGPLVPSTYVSPYLFEINLFVVNNKLNVHWGYSKNQFAKTTIAGLINAFHKNIFSITNLTNPFPEIDRKELNILLSQIK